VGPIPRLPTRSQVATVKICSRDGCHQWAYTDETLCAYDAKIRDGLITPDVQVYGRRWSAPRPRRALATVNPSDVVTDEQLEVAALMRAMGAEEAIISRAIAKDRRSPLGSGARGTGAKRGRVVV
jgi:hypothetical protein